MYLQDITKEFVFENNKCELKLKIEKEKIINWAKTIAGFANSTGGKIFLGVKNDNCELVGYEYEEADKEINFINNILTTNFYPRPIVRYNLLKYLIREKVRYVIEVIIEESLYKPVIFKYDGLPMIFMRREGYTNAATYEEIIKMANESQKFTYDTLLTSEKYDRENFRKMFSFYEKQNSKELTEKSLVSLGFYNSERFLTKGAIMFKDDYKGNAKVQCSSFNGMTRGDDKIVTINKYDCDILTGIELALEFVKQRMNNTYIKTKTGRKNIYSYPKRALLEGIVNAYAHRDYYIEGSQIQIDMFKDRLEITSPGSFYLGDNITKTYNLTSIISKRRNELICKILVICKLMESAGTGFDKISDDYSMVDVKHKPFIYSNSETFTLVLPDLTYVDGLGKTKVEIIYDRTLSNSKYDDEILSFCFENDRKIAQIATYLGISDSSYFRKNIIEELVQKELLLKTKIGNSYYYKTNKKLVLLNEYL